MRHSAAIPLIGWERFWRSELERKETHILILFSRTFFCINVFALNQHSFCEMCEEGIWALACVYGNTAFRGVWRIIGLSCECLLERRSNQLQFVFCTERLSLLQWRIGVFFQFCLPYLQQQSIISQFIITFFSLSLAAHCEHYRKTGLFRLTIFIRLWNHQPLCVSASTLHFKAMDKIKVKNFCKQLILILYILF